MTLVAAALLVTSVTVQDTVVVQAPEVGAWGDVRLVQEVRIGTVMGAEEEEFGRIKDVAVGSDGSIWIVDLYLKTIRVFNKDGSYRTAVGREGQGPGEFKQLMAIGPYLDGIATWDPGQARVSVFSLDGEFQRSYQPGVAGFSDRRQFVTDVYGNFYVKMPIHDGREMVAEKLVVVDEHGKIRGSIPLPPDGAMKSVISWTSSGLSYPYLETEKAVLTPLAYLVQGNTSEYSFTINTDPPTRVVKDWTPARIHGDERERWGDVFKSVLRWSASQPGAPPLDTHLPARKPAYKELWAGADGRIWVDLYSPAKHYDPPYLVREYPWVEPGRFDVFTPFGEFLGTVELPRHNELMFMEGDYIWTRETGLQREHYVVRYRLVHN